MTLCESAVPKNHSPGAEPRPLRERIHEALNHFRSSWLDMGRLLNEVAYGGDYKEWGYDDFEVYCARELGLKKPTVQKLMISYNYMRKYETKRLEEHEDGSEGAAPIPDFRTVELLDRVRRHEGIPEDDVENLHHLAFAGGDVAADEPAFRKELRATLRRESASSGPDRERVMLIRAAKAFRKALAASDMVPDGLRDRFERDLVELEALT